MKGRVVLFPLLGEEKDHHWANEQCPKSCRITCREPNLVMRVAVKTLRSSSNTRAVKGLDYLGPARSRGEPPLASYSNDIQHPGVESEVLGVSRVSLTFAAQS